MSKELRAVDFINYISTETIRYIIIRRSTIKTYVTLGLFLNQDGHFEILLGTIEIVNSL